MSDSGHDPIWSSMSFTRGQFRETPLRGPPIGRFRSFTVYRERFPVSLTPVLLEGTGLSFPPQLGFSAASTL
jgi:hypothetical protein